MILHTLFPDVRAEVIRRLFFNPTREVPVRQLARETTLALSTVQQELARLSKAGMVHSRSNRYRRFYRANTAHPAFSALQQLVITDLGATAFVNSHKRPRLSRARRRTRRPVPEIAPTIITSFGASRRII